MNKKTIVIAVLLLAGIAAGAVAWWKRPRLPELTASTDQLVAWRATDAWAKLPPEKQKSYTDELIKRPFPELLGSLEKLPEDQQRIIISGAMRDNPMSRAMDQYFKLPDGPDRTRLLDQYIDENEARRKEAQKRNPTTTPTTQPFAGNPAKWMKMIGESMPPQRMIQMMEFRAAVKNRQGQRGMSGSSGWR